MHCSATAPCQVQSHANEWLTNTALHMERRDEKKAKWAKQACHVNMWLLAALKRRIGVVRMQLHAGEVNHPHHLACLGPLSRDVTKVEHFWAEHGEDLPPHQRSS